MRKHLENARAQALAQVRGQIAFVERRRDSLIVEQGAMLERAAELTHTESDAETFSSQSIQPYYQYERHLARLVTDQAASLEALRQIESTRRQELTESIKNRRIVELLKERHVLAYRTYMNKEEQKLLDESATNSAASAPRSTHEE